MYKIFLQIWSFVCIDVFYPKETSEKLFSLNLEKFYILGALMNTSLFKLIIQKEIWIICIYNLFLISSAIIKKNDLNKNIFNTDLNNVQIIKII